MTKFNLGMLQHHSDTFYRLKAKLKAQPSVTTQVTPQLQTQDSSVKRKGRVNEIVGTIIKASLSKVSLGEVCWLETPGENFRIMAEVVGFQNHQVLLTPFGDIHGISSKTLVVPTGRDHQIAVGDWMLGRVIDGTGQPIDGLIADDMEPNTSVTQRPPNPMSRPLISNTINLGVKAIDSLLTCGEGQRMGIFAAAGVGKSSLLAMLVKNAQVDINVIALIGERGREVREFIELQLDPVSLKKTIIVVATSDCTSIERAQAAYVATSIAEHYREQGKKVLLLMDSVTRFARALREIGLAAGEAPARRGFPPSVFATLPRLLERSGTSEKGSITAFYTVLVEGDDMNEPIADEVRSILDGHIILSRKLASMNHYPAIDVLNSVSRVMDHIVDEQHKQAAAQLRRFLAKLEDIEMLVNLGEYVEGNDLETDMALSKKQEIEQFLVQSLRDNIDPDMTKHQLLMLVG